MGYTIEDMLLFSQNRYKMELIAGKNASTSGVVAQYSQALVPTGRDCHSRCAHRLWQ